VAGIIFALGRVSVRGRAIVFLDYMNVYQGARRAFFRPDDPHWLGQFNPLLLGQHLASASSNGCSLEQVRVYRGQPGRDRDPKGHAAAQRQFQAWQRSPLVKVVSRPMRYPRGWPDKSLPGARPQEKGIDVALAVDFAVMGVRGDYDVGILFSTDTDMLPTLEFVAGLTGPRAEVAAWSGADRRRLAIKSRNLYCHWVGEAAYRGLEDRTVYSKI
jgi:uncharacterized LabA/DUF88 family protein